MYILVGGEARTTRRRKREIDLLFVILSKRHTYLLMNEKISCVRMYVPNFDRFIIEKIIFAAFLFLILSTICINSEPISTELAKLPEGTRLGNANGISINGQSCNHGQPSRVSSPSSSSINYRTERLSLRSSPTVVHAELFNYRQRNQNPVTFPERQSLLDIRPPDPANIKFTAVTDNHYFFLHKLYLEEWNADLPSVTDPVMENPSIRSRICEDISNSGVFARYERVAVDMTGFYGIADSTSTTNPSNLNSSAWREAYGTIFQHANSDDLYMLREFQVYEFFLRRPDLEPVPIIKKEYVFVCLLRHEDSGDVMPFYVSKAYNASDGLRTHRFVFPMFPESEKYRFFYDYEKLMLAEGSAHVYSWPDFDIENYYVQNQRPSQAEICEFDPVCKLNSTSLEDNQHLRLCNVVLTSAHFKDTIKYPLRQHHDGWFHKKISFKNTEIKNLLAATGNDFQEQTLRCYVETTVEGASSEVFYISRAYNPHQVFVYSEDPLSKEVYLEALCFNVGIVDSI